MRTSFVSGAIVASILAVGSSACSAQDEPTADEARVETDMDAGAPEDSAANTGEEAAPEDGGDGAVEDADADAPTVDAADDADTAAAEDDRVTAEARAEYAALTGDADAGARVFRQCMACHSVEEGQNRVGPSLHGVIGREAGTVDGFRYSSANRDSHVVWTEEALFVYLENPRQFIPRTTMAFVGVRDAQQRADLIAYLRENTD